MRPQPSHLYYVNQPIHGLLRSLQHPHSQHESDMDADSAVQAASASSGPSPESKGPQMANAGPYSRSGSGQGHIQGNVRLGERAGLDPEPSKTGSTWPNEPAIVDGEHHPARQEPSPGPATQSVAFEDQNAHLVPLSGLKSLAIDSFDDDPSLLPSSIPPRAGAPPLPLLGADSEIEWEADNAPTGLLGLPLELRKKIYAHLLIADMISAEEEADTVLPILPSHGCSSSLGIHTEILRANKKIHGEAAEALYGANDWLLVRFQDENALEAILTNFRMPLRRVNRVSRRFCPFMEIKFSIGRDHGFYRNGRRLGKFPSKIPRRKFILDLATFQRLCNQRIYQMELSRGRTHLQVWHKSYHPDEPKHTAEARSQVERMIGRMDGQSVTRWYLSRGDDEPPRLTREAIASITGAPSLHEARPQTPPHIFQHVNIIAQSARNAAIKNDDRGVRFQAMECLRYVHAATLGLRDRKPHEFVPPIRDMLTHIARTTAPLVLRGIEITIAMGNTTQAHKAALELQYALWNHRPLTTTSPQLLCMTMEELACVSFLQAKAFQRCGHVQAVISHMRTLFTRWSNVGAHTIPGLYEQQVFMGAPHVWKVVDGKRGQVERYNYEIVYLPMLEWSVEQFLQTKGVEKEKVLETALVHALDHRLHNWLFPKHCVETVGPCWVWPWSDAWLED